MKNLIRIALATGVAALGASAFIPNVNAQTANVDFTGVVPSSCVVSAPIAGSMVLGGINNSALTSNPASGGVRGGFTANCNSSVTLTVSGIVANASSYTADQVGALLFRNGTGTTAAKGVAMTAGVPSPVSGGTPSSVFSSGAADYTIDLNIINGYNVALPVGSYNTSVSVLLTPQ